MRELNLYRVYKHYKEYKDEEKALYVTTGIAYKVNEIPKEYNEQILFLRTDEGNEDVLVDIYRVKDNYYYHSSDLEGELVLYTALYGKRLSYVREKNEFLSRVPRTGYNQEFRFEEI